MGKRSNTKTILRSTLNKLSKDQRKVIQYNLAAEEFYNSSIDGLYGRGTATALKTYNKGYFNYLDLGKSSNVKALLEDVSKDNPAEVKEPKVAIAVEPKVQEPKVAEPPLDFAQVKASYDAGEYRKAFNDANVLLT